MPPTEVKKRAATLRLSETAWKLLFQIAERGGTNMTAMLEQIIRQVAKEQGLWS